MEVEPDPVKEVKPEAVEEEMKKQKQEQKVANNNATVATKGDNAELGSCKVDPDLSEKIGVPHSRLETMTTSGPDATIPARDQLTIFYGGKVVVFDAIPAEKVREIMLIAAAAVKPDDIKKTGPAYHALTPILTRTLSMQSTAGGVASPQAQLYPVDKSSLRNMQAELPIARRHSLQRFLEKRRDRLVSKGPYPTSSGAKTSETTKPDFSAEASMGAACFEKPSAREEEHQPKVVANPA